MKEFERLYLKKQDKYISVRWFQKDMIEEAMNLREKIFASLKDKDLFAKALRDDFFRYLNDGFGLVCIDNEKLIACAFCVLNNVEYAVDRKYSTDKVKKCADLEDVYVDLEYRGNGIQMVLMNMMAEACTYKDKKFILATVSPKNNFSYNNFIELGYKEVDRMLKYGGLDRVFMEKEL